jgi:hypothetical protein
MEFRNAITFQENEIRIYRQKNGKKKIYIGLVHIYKLKLKTKLSHHTPRWRLGGEEV